MDSGPRPWFVSVTDAVMVQSAQGVVALNMVRKGCEQLCLLVSSSSCGDFARCHVTGW